MSVLVREATREGRRIVVLRCYDSNGATLVEAEVTPVGQTSSIQRGPYRFPSAPEAFRFVQEALLSLQYLGCQIA